MGNGFDVGIESLFPLKVLLGKEVWWIPQPSVEQALVINGLLPYYQDADCKDRIRYALAKWLPAKFLNKLEEISWESQVNELAGLIQRCVPEREDNEVENAIYERTVDINYLLAEYRAWYHTNPLQESWGFFLAQAKILPVVKANIELSNVSWYTAAKSTKQFDGLFKRAGFKLKEVDEDNGYDFAAEIERSKQLSQMFNG